MIYVLYVQGGKEPDIVQELRRIGFTAYAPRQIRRYRVKGVVYNISEVMFGGYVFIDLPNGVHPEDYYKIVKVNGVGKFISRTCCLSPTEEEYIRKLYSGGDKNCIAHGTISNGTLKIDKDSWLKPFESHIVKFSKRQHRVTVELTFYGKPHRMVCACDIE